MDMIETAASPAAPPSSNGKTLVFLIAAVAIVVLGLAAGCFYLWSAYAPSLSKAVTHPRTIVIVRNPPSLDGVWADFVKEMEGRGYAEGKNVQYVVMEIGTDLANTEAKLSAVLAENPADLIFTMGIIATRAAKEVTEAQHSSVPVVFAVVSDPTGSGLVESLQRSGNNLTGVTPTNELAASKRLELVKEMLPATKRVIYAWNDEVTSGIGGMRIVAPALGLTLVDEQVADVDAIVNYYDTFTFKEGDVLVRPSDAIGGGSIEKLIAIALQKHIPLIGTHEGDVKKGALMSYGAQYEGISAQAAAMAERVLAGTLPSDIPVEEASTFELSINLTTAQSLTLVIPDTFLSKAAHVFGE